MNKKSQNLLFLQSTCRKNLSSCFFLLKTPYISFLIKPWCWGRCSEAFRSSRGPEQDLEGWAFADQGPLGALEPWIFMTFQWFFPKKYMVKYMVKWIFPKKIPNIWYMVKYPIIIICGWYIPIFYDFPIILGIHIFGIINMTNIKIKHPKYPTDWYLFILWLSYHIGNIIIPTDELHHFSEGLKQPPTRYFWCQEAFCYDFETGWLSVIRIWGSDVSHVRKFRAFLALVGHTMKYFVSDTSASPARSGMTYQV